MRYDKRAPAEHPVPPLEYACALNRENSEDSYAGHG
jgi:hypothetical protein